MKWRIFLAFFLAMMMASLIPLVVPSISEVASPVLCPAGTEAKMEREFWSDRRGNGMELVMYCYDADGDRERVDSFKVFLVEIGMFFIPSLIIVQLFIMWFNSIPVPQQQKPAAVSPGLALNTGEIARVDALTPRSIPAVPTDESLKARLEQLTSARTSGLITQDEYERKRREILERF